ncbi:predicted protein [Phaeodactylum tricornutum CCAP 1055/1]|jgi:hypothetical protein|uniref:PUB domain-containing protein n=3 Tax=Phaeodactylum tricornutum TaxID=2850 RepID=B7GCV7_PHATC|nr:predicted protein [Phaeodactylum tricornutum CCAP 1055/1]EEC43683.1 predicted protein [Phaeodactylum tricornutum CCAP 1055/1]|eukprot:XP_002184947.1 predicted protein [Phaeodactylum tricornutum CCAP 1055/1]
MSSNVSKMHLDFVVEDGSTTTEQKSDCLKLLKVVVKNLADPVKSKDEKFQTLKLDNPKVSEKLLPCPSAKKYLLSLGFTERTTPDYQKILFCQQPHRETFQKALRAVSDALGKIGAPVAKKPRTVEESLATLAPTPSTLLPFERLSEKQKARRLMEEKDQREKELAKVHRAKAVEQLRRDKFVRENDPNWKSGPSAAVNKTGNTIATFRDRHGET